MVKSTGQSNSQNGKKVVGGWNVYLNKNNQTVMYDPMSMALHQ
jgi:hypothetical protein